MERIQFETTVERSGVLRIPEKYSKALAEGKNVRVTVMDDKPKTNATVKFLEENPIHAPGFRPMKRDDLYDRQ